MTLYRNGGKVYIASESWNRTRAAIHAIFEQEVTETGSMKFLRLVLDDLTTIKRSIDDFLEQEKTLDVLYNIAGVGVTKAAGRTMQGHELKIGVEYRDQLLGSFSVYEATTSSTNGNSYESR
ncbi:hypothetical protein BJ878DRAFT_254876 [Calycina marina]|uniref:Uncharacterized protein n=1 Tax=Calycina marina TaxID=1763456 RepID=A0A9P7YWF7_9HELO|nr:hypothetical protein BJ878DRAFT_254876 [Calycina marina]